MSRHPADQKPPASHRYRVPTRANRRGPCRYSAFAAGLAFLVPLLLLTPVASATQSPSPAWQLASEVIPTNLSPGGTGELLLHVRNIGTGATDGSQVRVVDRLPAGVTATAAGDRLFEAEGVPPGSSYWSCTGTTVVTCINNPENLTAIAPGPELTAGHEGTAPFIGIEVTVAPDAAGTAVNTLEVAGGGAASVRRTEPTAIATTPAGFGFQGFEQQSLNGANSLDTQAGSHPYEMTTRFAQANRGRPGEGEVELSGEMKNLELTLPPGFVGNPTATPTCPRAAFDSGRRTNNEPSCKPDTRVGTIALAIANPYTIFELPVYNLEPPAGVAAQFGFAFTYKVGFINFSVRTGEGYAVKAVLSNAYQLNLLSSYLTLWGVPGEHGTGAPPVPLLRNPTSCGVPLATVMNANSWEEPANTISETIPWLGNSGNQLQITGCTSVKFTPTLEIHPTTSAASTPTGLNVDLRIPQNEQVGELAQADLRDAHVTLPAGITVSPSAANGREACTPTEIGLSGGARPNCPDASKLGEVEVFTPLLARPLTGAVYLAQQNANPFGSLIAIYIVAEGSGTLIKLAGHVELDATTGQLSVAFDENPQLPFSDLKLRFFQGPRAALVTPAQCGTYTPTAQLTGWNGTVLAPPVEGFSIDKDCTHAFSPALAAGSESNQAGAFAPFSATITRPDGDRTLGAISLTAPPGLLGMLSHVTLCAEPQATQGDCPPDSLIGRAAAVAGPGPNPVTVTGGQVFLTGPYHGAPFGLSILVPAVAGPFNLGDVTVRASIDIDPRTGQITIVSAPLPTILQGIPLDIRSVTVTADRSGFMFNPTSCDPLAVSATVSSVDGASAPLSTRFQAAGCASLPFKPAFTASTRGNGSRRNGAAFTVRVSTRQGPGANPAVPGEANIRRVEVQLPTVLPSRLSTLQKACTEAQFAANPAGCPAASAVGYATARTPVLPVPLTGPAYLVSHGGEAFPDLVVILQGDGVRIDLTGHTEITGGHTYSRFETVPDAPVESFELRLPEGPNSILGAFGNLCGRTTKTTVTRHLTRRVHGRVIHSTVRVKKIVAAPLQMPTTITAQNGAVIKQTTLIAATGCTAARSARTATGARKANRARRGPR